jgi:tetratricopeptide (TPR) repeat protein
MTVIAKHALVVVTMFAAAIGGLLFDRYPIFGSILIAAGLVGSVCVYRSSESAEDANEQLLRATAQLMFASGAGSVYTKLIREKMLKPGGHKTAKRDLEKALNAVPDDPDALLLYGGSEVLRYSFRVLVSSNGRQDDVYRQRIQSVIERGLGTGRYVPEFYCMQGILLDVSGDWEEARRCFSKASDIEPSWRWRLFKSTSYGMEGNYAAALYEIEKALEEGASGYLVDYYYGRCLASVGEFNRAVYLFQRVRRQRGLFYHLAVSLQEAYYFEWRPFMSAYYEARASLMVLLSSLFRRGPL